MKRGIEEEGKETVKGKTGELSMNGLSEWRGEEVCGTAAVRVSLTTPGRGLVFCNAQLAACVTGGHLRCRTPEGLALQCSALLRPQQLSRYASPVGVSCEVEIGETKMGPLAGSCGFEQRLCGQPPGQLILPVSPAARRSRNHWDWLCHGFSSAFCCSSSQGCWASHLRC